MYEILGESTNLCVEILNSRRQIKQRGTLSRATNSRFPFDVSVIPNLASILSEWLRDPKKGDFKELKSKKFPGGACSRTP